MIHQHSEMKTEVKERLRGGQGSPAFRYLFSAEELGNRAEMLATVTLEPGATAKYTTSSPAPPSSPRTA